MTRERDTTGSSTPVGVNSLDMRKQMEHGGEMMHYTVRMKNKSMNARQAGGPASRGKDTALLYDHPPAVSEPAIFLFVERKQQK